MSKELAEKANKILQRSQTSSKTPKHEKYADFKETYEGREVVITLHNGVTIKGKALEVRPYWIRFLNEKNEVLLINKAYVMLIRVL
ncbi:MAG: hypothetical protein QW123_03400 [Desulfurococcaceae archaeon]